MPNSPGVYSRELDVSFYTPSDSGLVLGIVGGAHKGVLNTATLVTSQADYYEKFGKPTTQAGYAASLFLRKGTIQMVRIGDGTEAEATVTVQGGGPAADAFSATVQSTGTWGNDLSIRVAEASSGSTAQINLSVLLNGNPVESYVNITETLFAAIDSEFVDLAVIAWPVWAAANYGDFDLTGGLSGVSALTTADYVGTAANEPTASATGLQCLVNKEVVTIDLVATPGFSETGGSSALPYLITLAEERQDCIAILDPPDNLDAATILEWEDGTGYAHSALNSSYATFAWQWHEYYDAYSDDTVWMAPSGVVATLIAQSRAMGEVWDAPAGLRRGKVPWTQSIRANPDKPTRDAIYATAGNNVNPFVNFPSQGIVLWGQKTLQRSATALDRLNVRLLMNYLNRKVEGFAKNLLFEGNTQGLRNTAKAGVESIIGPVLTGGGVYAYEVVCNETNNTPAVIDANELKLLVLVKPTKTAEVVKIDWTILSTSASFSEYI